MIDYSKKTSVDGDTDKLGVWHRAVLTLLNADGKKVLDLGCGTGGFLKHISSQTQEILGVDPNKHNCDVAVHNGVQALPIYPGQLSGYDNHFDIVTCFEVIEHLYDHHEIVGTCARVLKPHGRAYITTPNAFHIARMMTFVFRQEHRDPLMDPTLTDEPEHIRLWSYGMAHRITKRHLHLKVAHVYGCLTILGRTILIRNELLVRVLSQHLIIIVTKE